MKYSLPYFTHGKVVKGFGRGSKSLGTPTANFEQGTVEQLPPEFPTGIYFGWAQVNHSPIYPMVTSIGWNPYFANKTKSMETHIMHPFPKDFYGSELRICLTGYLRNELNFKSIDDLKVAIQNDITEANRLLSKPEFECLRHDLFFYHADASPKEITANEVSTKKTTSVTS